MVVERQQIVLEPAWNKARISLVTECVRLGTVKLPRSIPTLASNDLRRFLSFRALVENRPPPPFQIHAGHGDEPDSRRENAGRIKKFAARNPELSRPDFRAAAGPD